MQCKFCKNPATIHLSQIVDDKVVKVDLCEECAKAKGVDDPVGYSLTDLLTGLGASNTKGSGPKGSPEPACPRCGYTQADFKKTGRLGCPTCYETFHEGMESLLKSMHRGTRHQGKTPAAMKKTVDFSEKLDTLQADLQAAIEREDYERAATLRDQIKQLKEENPGSLTQSA